MREIVRARHVLLKFNGRDVLNISELSVAENERIGLIGASGSGAPRPLQKPHRGFCDTGLRVPDRKTKTAPLGRPLFWCRKWDSALRVRSACAPRSACAAAALPGPYKSPTGAFAIRGFESLIAKQKPPRWGGLWFGAARQSKSEPFLLLIASCNFARVMVFVPSL